MGIGGTGLLTLGRTLQRAIAPAFIPGGTMALPNGRLGRLADLRRAYREGPKAVPAERRPPVHRARLADRGIAFPIVAACLLCVLVIAAFIAPPAGETLGNRVALLPVAAMSCLTMSVLSFLAGVPLSAHDPPLRHDRP